MIKWIHHLLEPHCPHCIEERECNSCNDLRDQLQHERNVNRDLVNALVALTKPEKEIIIQQGEAPKPFNRHISWNQQRSILESEDRANAEAIRKKQTELKESLNKTTEELEQELKIAR